MGTVYEIELYQVSVSGSGDGFHVNACWTVKQSPKPYDGDFTAEIVENFVTVAKTSVSGGEREADFQDVSLDPEANCLIRISASEQPSVSSEVPLLLKTYKNVKADYDGEILFLRWDRPGKGIRNGQCRILPEAGGNYLYDIPVYARGIRIAFDEELCGAQEGMRICLTPYITECSSGPEYVIENFVRPAYVPDEQAKTLRYRSNSQKETEIAWTLQAASVFQKKGETEKIPENPISHGPLCLGCTKPYTLTIQTAQTLERTEYDKFVAECYEYVTASAMYEILDIISRAAMQRVDDMLYYHCGFSQEKRCADLRPGFALRVEQAAYQYQNGMDEGDISGFSGNGSSVYKVSLQRGREMEYLEFDSFVSMLEVELYSLQSTAGQQQTGSGILDLSSVNIRNPYYRIQYPDGMFTSDVPPDIIPGNHPFLLGAPGWEDVPLTVSSRISGERDGISETVPYLLFRGRAALTLLLTVTVNGREELVPAGTTFEKLFRQKGICNADFDSLRIFRRSPYGKEACMANVPESAAFFSNLPLMHGDRIEI